MWERNISPLPPICAPTGGPDPQPRRVPWLGIELAVFCFVEQHPTKWATLAWSDSLVFKDYFSEKISIKLYVLCWLLELIQTVLALSIFLRLLKRPNNIYERDGISKLKCFIRNWITTSFWLSQENNFPVIY